MLRIEDGEVVNRNITDVSPVHGILICLKDAIAQNESNLNVQYLTKELRSEINYLRGTADFIEKELDAITGENK